jgi:NAD(P)-dependent dehydrogenase (short-subunit alcohol dehydrogenase family)
MPASAHPFDLTGKIALVTGAYRGLGFAIAQGLARAGATVMLNGRKEGELARAVKALTDQGLAAGASVFDVTDAKAVRAAVAAIEAQHGRLDILVNNAGITLDKTVRKMSDDDWDRVIQVNLSGAFYLIRASLQHMLDRGSGRIINISSVIGEAGNIGQANYAAAKAGLFGLTMSLAQETARKGITVNSVAPGYIATEMVAAVPPEAMARVLAKIPAGRLGEPDEVARVVEFLADPDSSFITGQIYAVNGGQHM